MISECHLLQSEAHKQIHQSKQEYFLVYFILAKVHAHSLDRLVAAE